MKLRKIAIKPTFQLVTLVQQPDKEKLLILKAKAHSIHTTNISYRHIFFKENSPTFSFLDKREPQVNKYKITGFCIFKSSFVVNPLIVKPEKVVLSKM